MSKPTICRDDTPGNVILFPEPMPRLRSDVPPFDPNNPAYLRAWEAIFDFGAQARSGRIAMGEPLSPLDLELAAYNPMELAELDDTIRILLEAANDGTAAYAAARGAVYATLRLAISRRLVAEVDTRCTATIIPFRGRE